MKSLAKALLIIVCLICSCWMVQTDHAEVGVMLLIFGGLVAVFYEATWK